MMATAAEEISQSCPISDNDITSVSFKIARKNQDRPWKLRFIYLQCCEYRRFSARCTQYINAPSIQSVWVECECSPLFQEGKQARMRKYFTLDYLILWVVSSHLSAWMSKCSRCDSYELSDDVIL